MREGESNGAFVSRRGYSHAASSPGHHGFLPTPASFACEESPEEVITMAGTADYERAANTLPKDRTAAQQALVNDAHAKNMVTIKNLDHAAGNKQRFGG